MKQAANNSTERDLNAALYRIDRQRARDDIQSLRYSGFTLREAAQIVREVYNGG